jgi:3-mercaptopyruvate sulfurtransferase SseA
MSTKKRPKGKQRSSDLSSLLIPIIVGVVVVAIIVGAIFLNEKHQTVTADVPGTLSVPIVTAEPLPTTGIPYPDVPRISLADAKSSLDKGQAVLIDVRSQAEYDQSHAVGALLLPSDQVESRLTELPRDKLLILYCT